MQSATINNLVAFPIDIQIYVWFVPSSNNNIYVKATFYPNKKMCWIELYTYIMLLCTTSSSTPFYFCLCTHTFSFPFIADESTLFQLETKIDLIGPTYIYVVALSSVSNDKNNNKRGHDKTPRKQFRMMEENYFYGRFYIANLSTKYRRFFPESFCRQTHIYKWSNVKE
jgi:hypothetical protein